MTSGCQSDPTGDLATSPPCNRITSPFILSTTSIPWQGTRVNLRCAFDIAFLSSPLLRSFSSHRAVLLGYATPHRTRFYFVGNQQLILVMTNISSLGWFHEWRASKRATANDYCRDWIWRLLIQPFGKHKSYWIF